MAWRVEGGHNNGAGGAWRESTPCLALPPAGPERARHPPVSALHFPLQQAAGLETTPAVGRVTAPLALTPARPRPHLGHNLPWVLARVREGPQQLDRRRRRVPHRRRPAAARSLASATLSLNLLLRPSASK